MISPKKKKKIKLQLEMGASRRLSKVLKEELAAQKGPLKLVEGQTVATQFKAVTKTIADAMDWLQEGRRYAQDRHEGGFQTIRYDGSDSYESMVKSLLETWKANHALNLHSEAHKDYPYDVLRDLRDDIVQKEADNGKARKLTTLDEY